MKLVAIFNVGFIGLVIAVAFLAIHGNVRHTFVGIICAGLTIIMYASPLSAMINIYLKVIKTIAFNVKRSKTIKNIKAMLHSKEGISENLQELFLTGERLQDDKKLVDYGIQRNSTLHLVLQAPGTITSENH
ncbi:ubiquitin-like [Cornus florida]|uniref:ubiquitin-like n=1 Tax=Cornus florida TaxID=4283 RepID=UPI00289AC159|nr:ubiquitin-like [Cornus florida]